MPDRVNKNDGSQDFEPAIRHSLIERSNEPSAINVEADREQFKRDCEMEAVNAAIESAYASAMYCCCPEVAVFMAPPFSPLNQNEVELPVQPREVVCRAKVCPGLVQAPPPARRRTLEARWRRAKRRFGRR